MSGPATITVAYRDLRRVADAYAEVGKVAVAAWLRDQDERLRSEGYGPDDLVSLELKPDAEWAN